ncbi:MAG: hypothetical protein ABSG46_19945 [Candidatus Binataceae bacterium]
MAQDQEKNRSVFDFLYVDQSRLELYLAQFSEFGNLTKLVRSVGQTDENTLGTDLKVIKGDTKSGQITEIEKHYDPRWVAPLTFLEEAADRKMLKSDLTGTGLGDFVILKGNLTVVDMRALENAFKAASQVEKSPGQTGNRKHRRSEQARSESVDSLEDFTPFKLLAALEQPMIVHFATGVARLWSTVNPSNLVGASNDLHLKHGVSIAGSWHLIGVLDCLPGASDSPSVRICGDGENAFSESMTSMIGEIKKVMGRPAECYGVTPLIIMREAASAAK